MNKIRLLILITFGLSASTVQAAGAGFSLSIAYDLGGDELAEVVDKDGDHLSTVRANGGITFGAGFVLPLSRNLGLQSSIGYKSYSEETKNGDEISWKSFPWETSIIAHLGQFELGGGVIYHLSPEYKSDVGRSSGNIDFDDALGYQAQAAYLIKTSVGDGLSLGLRYTSIDFEKNRLTLDGDSVGFFVKFYL
ncbi:MAG: hypothetical protein DSZ28_09135 [Thiothrix sp.]|nr:MAG: hypothetical protein DSZ28_09135 [Thiothrix sp.]